MLAVTVILAAGGCRDDVPTALPCRNVPDGGCPRSKGVSCEDPSCRAVYLCREGNVWELEQTCPSRPPPAPVDASVRDALPDALPDAPPGAWGGPGCGPLQVPDCALAVGLACPGGCCGCDDFFVCEGGGWNLWGTCSNGRPTKSK